MNALSCPAEFEHACKVWSFCYRREKYAWHMTTRLPEAEARPWWLRYTRWQCARLRVQARDWRLVPREERRMQPWP